MLVHVGSTSMVMNGCSEATALAWLWQLGTLQDCFLWRREFNLQDRIPFAHVATPDRLNALGEGWGGFCQS
jgi:hypothetical protein